VDNISKLFEEVSSAVNTTTRYSKPLDNVKFFPAKFPETKGTFLEIFTDSPIDHGR
jgi:hypothetical protein